MLLGLKLIENRAWRISPGWYALHVGAQRNSEWGLRAAEAYPELPSEDQLGHFFSSVVGLLHIAEQRSTDQCGSHCWAYGPVCHVVSHAVQLPVPLPQRGAQGLWPLPDALRRRIQEQVRSISAKQELSAQVSFRDWWAPGGVLRCHDLTELGPLSTRPPAAQEPAQAQPPRFSLHMAASSSTTPREPLLSQTYVMRGGRGQGLGRGVGRGGQGRQARAGGASGAPWQEDQARRLDAVNGKPFAEWSASALPVARSAASNAGYTNYGAGGAAAAGAAHGGSKPGNGQTRDHSFWDADGGKVSAYPTGASTPSATAERHWPRRPRDGRWS